MIQYPLCYKDKVGGVYIISGIQLYPYMSEMGITVKEWKRRAVAYCDALATEMSRTLNPGDVVLMNTAHDTYDFLQNLVPEKYGFREMDFTINPEEKVVQGEKNEDIRVYEKIEEREVKES